MRYKVLSESILGHDCCFSNSVVDTAKSDRYVDYVLMCECINEETANLVCSALNMYDTIANEVEKSNGGLQ